MADIGGFLMLSGAILWLFARLNDWRYQGGPAKWSPKFWRAQSRVGIVLVLAGLPLVIGGLLAR